jgi:hypothetical protein
MGGLFRILLLIGVIAKLWPLLVAVLAAAALGFLAWCAVTHHTAELERRRRAQAAIAARADRQHAWTLAGDERGVYGDYRPKVYPG